MSGALWAAVPPPWRDRLAALGDLAARHDLPAALVGGSVRDLVLGRTPRDWDVVVEGAAGPLVRSMARSAGASVTAHPAFLTFALRFADGTSLDVATARRETYARPAALPTVRPAALAEDFARRDFSVNAMALWVVPARRGELLDPLGGRGDVDLGLLRALHPASFDDDPTRVYRAARYAGRYGWVVEPGTREWIRRAVSAGRLGLLSSVRRRNEIFHLLEEDDPRPAFAMLDDWNVSPHHAPPIDAARVRALGASPAGADRLPVRLAALLGPDRAVAGSRLKAVQTPVALRRRVDAFLADEAFLVDTFGRKN